MLWMKWNIINELAQRELCAKEVYNVLRIVIVKRRKGKDCYVLRLLILGSMKYVARFFVQNLLVRYISLYANKPTEWYIISKVSNFTVMYACVVCTDVYKSV